MRKQIHIRKQRWKSGEGFKMRTSCNDLNLLSWGVARIRSQGRPAGAVESNESVGTIENSITTKEDPLGKSTIFPTYYITHSDLSTQIPIAQPSYLSPPKP